MDYQYDLNKNVFMFCVVIANSRRWSDIDEQEKVIREWKGKIDDDIYDLMSYGLNLMINGRDPKLVEFYTAEFIHNMCEGKKLSSSAMKDLRLVREAILWIHCGEGDRLEELVSSISDIEFKSHCKTWMFLNQFNFRLTFDEFRLMNNENIQELIKTKPYIMEK